MYIRVAFRILGGRPMCLPSRAHTLVRPYLMRPYHPPFLNQELREQVHPPRTAAWETHWPARSAISRSLSIG